MERLSKFIQRAGLNPRAGHFWLTGLMFDTPLNVLNTKAFEILSDLYVIPDGDWDWSAAV